MITDHVPGTMRSTTMHSLLQSLLEPREMGPIVRHTSQMKKRGLRDADHPCRKQWSQPQTPDCLAPVSQFLFTLVIVSWTQHCPGERVIVALYPKLS